MLATEYATYYKIEAQREGESDAEFKSRVSGALRDMGKLIEAHEAFNDKRWDESENVMDGISGALAQMLQGVDYRVSGETQVGTDIAAGKLLKAPKREDNAAALLAMLLMMQRD